MTAKHPAPHEDDQIPMLPSTTQPRAITTDEVQESLKSFPVGSSGGLDDLTVQHILDLLSVGGELRRILLVNLLKKCDVFARGQIPDCLDLWHVDAYLLR